MTVREERAALQAPNLLLFGCDFFAARKASEVNFWNDIVELAATWYPEVVVVSVNNRDVAVEKLADNVTLYNVPPIYPGRARRTDRDREYSGRRFQRLPGAPLYKSATFLHHRSLLSEVIERHRIGLVHYMRIFGGFNRALVRRHPRVAFTITVPTFVDRGYPLHRLYHAIRNRTYRAFDRVIATTEATADALRRTGLDTPVQVIHWGTGAAPQLVMRHKPAGEGEPVLVLWAGPLQGTGRAEYAFALDVANRVAARSDRFRFVFAFKPEKLTPALARMAAETPHVSVRETTKDDFEQLRRHADLFLSPVCNGRRTVAPPLTWIEVMNSGTPVLTTPVAGVDELVRHGHNGLVVKDPAEAALEIEHADRGRLERLGRSAAETVAERFSIELLTSDYCRAWDALMTCKQRLSSTDARSATAAGRRGQDAGDSSARKR